MSPANIGIIGVGLMGASFALALRRGGFKGEIRGYDTADVSACLPQIDTLERLCEISDVLVLATPPGEFHACMRGLLPCWTPEKILTDVGSVKVSVVEQARRVFGCGVSGFVPGHPVAGSEKGTAAAARADLFAGAKVILTPLEETRAGAYTVVRDLWEMTGARTERMDSAAHDRIFAMVSHLPHMAAYALVNCVIENEGSTVGEYASGGFRDYTRVAGSSPVMWRDVCLANRKNLASALQA